MRVEIDAGCSLRWDLGGYDQPRALGIIVTTKHGGPLRPEAAPRDQSLG